MIAISSAARARVAACARACQGYRGAYRRELAPSVLGTSIDCGRRTDAPR